MVSTTGPSEPDANPPQPDPRAAGSGTVRRRRRQMGAATRKKAPSRPVASAPREALMGREVPGASGGQAESVGVDAPARADSPELADARGRADSAGQDAVPRCDSHGSTSEPGAPGPAPDVPLRLAGITDDPLLDELAERIRCDDGGVVHVTGLWGSAGSLVAGGAANRLRGVVLFVTSHLEQADDALDDLELFSERPCQLFPAWEGMPREGAGSGEIEAERLRVLTQLHRLCAASRPEREIISRSGPGSSRRRQLQRGCGERWPQVSPADTDESAPIIVVPVQSLLQPAPAPGALAACSMAVAVGDAPTPDAIVDWALSRGYQRLDLLESVGDVALRGDILDIFPPGETDPVRIHFFGDQIEKMHRFDVGTQRSGAAVGTLHITAVRPPAVDGEVPAVSLLNYLPASSVVLLDSPAEIQESAQTYHRRLGPDAGLWSPEAVFEELGSYRQVHLSRFGAAAVRGEGTLHFGVRSISRFETVTDSAVAELCELAGRQRVTVACDNEGERKRLAELIVERCGSMPANLSLIRMRLHRGFEWTRSSTMIVAHHELFHRRRPRRRIRRVQSSRSMETWVDLKPGDHVVHTLHGIARYRGLRTMARGDANTPEDYLVLEFADQAKIYVPTTQVDLVQKYIGAGGVRPTLSKLGGRRWKKTKERVEGAVEEMAESLLRIQATREASEGQAYPADTEWQAEFEASFPYQETEDQVVVARELKDDLCKGRPMDRLICGDVGYGKTELAMRAAFKVMEFGRQVAVLVPTTVLAEQHFETFVERFADYPFLIGCLSRFRTPAEQRRLIQATKKGQTDLVIGTHRLLSKDVGFANLGLVIIDEEQRFGVEHKERLKRLRETVDVVTLSATPIPRTLHMAMTGVRDISTLQTPPIDRRSIATQIVSFSQALVRDAILREMNREGQVFFVHNYVRSIQAMADRLRAIVPDARILVGHGQMKERELEDVMMRFAHRRADVLLCTTIIESGIDIPTANTIFIHHADRFGLADLHQLRGRVGRSHHRGYCYLLIAEDRPVRPKAAKRLKAIEEFSELGGGFRIAMRDLEIRGAGNMLGSEQSGHIAAVGYDLYCRLLENTVRRLRNEPPIEPVGVHVELELSGHVPASYIKSERARVEIYRRLVTCRTIEDIDQLSRDLTDTFGPIPPQVRLLMDLAELRVRAYGFGIRSIVLHPPDVVFMIDKMARVQPVFEDAPGTVRWPDAETIHLRPPRAYLEPSTLLNVLRRMLIRAAENDVAVAKRGG